MIFPKRRRGTGVAKHPGVARSAVLLLAINGCTPEPKAPEVVRPDWRGAAFDGIAPLMTPAQVGVALRRGGYRQRLCGTGGSLGKDPLRHGEASSCYRAASRNIDLQLFFFNLPEGRRLAVASFRADPGGDDARRQAAARRFAGQLRTRFGPPSTTVDGGFHQTLYWYLPGGEPSLPDHISTTIDSYSGPNVTLVSMWSYGEEGRAASAPSSISGG